MKNNLFCIERENELILGISHPEDPHNMNWVESKNPLGTVICQEDLSVKREYSLCEDYFEYTVELTNNNSYDIVAQRGSIGIFVPFNDSYGPASLCMTRRCHAHLDMCGSSAYIMGIRMGGEAPHLGMVLTEGEFTSYSIKRENKSNDRGDFILHIPYHHFVPNSSYTLKMRFFWHNGEEDFYKNAAEISTFVKISSEHFTYFEGERICINAALNSDNIRSAKVFLDGKAIGYDVSKNNVSVVLDGVEIGAHKLCFDINGRKNCCELYVSASFEDILLARCRFIVDKQQMNNEASPLDGAYLSYDNKEQCIVYNYSKRNHNSSRERICMAILIAMQLRIYKDKLSAEQYTRQLDSLHRYVIFFKREIYDVNSGTVSNDIGHENSRLRLYNYPWPVRFFLEMLLLEGKDEYLDDAVTIMREYYRLGGTKFYAFTIPLYQLCSSLKNAGRMSEYEEFLAYFTEHAEVMIANGTNYPAHEVSYEQSIVAPAAEFMLQMYALTNNDRYLKEAHNQVAIARLFSGDQPDYHLYRCAIRHWDDFWFGKSELYGDTFPHYWSVLSANVFEDYFKVTSDIKWHKMAEDAFRGQLCQFDKDGHGSCALLYPFTVNGKAGNFLDDWANDQDWALVYYLDYLSKK